MNYGDHLKVSRGLYSHHGIYVGDNEVIHYSGELLQKAGASIRRATLADFAAGCRVEVVEYGGADAAGAVVERAKSRLGEDGYSVWRNNCEHFARWCKTGRADSEQVRDGVSGVAAAGGVGAAAAGSVGVVAAAGTVIGMSGPGVMSGLAAVGGTVGAGAVGGVTVLASGPVLVTTVAMRSLLKDDASLPAPEREARALGRSATLVGGAVGTAGTVAAISASGAVAGLSGAGIASGLAAIGATFGGGMAAGVAVTVAAPAVAAAGIGYGVYRLWRKMHWSGAGSARAG